MSRKSIFSLALLILSPLVIYLLWPSDENRIKKLFKEGAKAIEGEKIDDVMARVSFNYTDDYGFSYLVLKRGLEQTFQQISGIQIEYKITDLAIKDGKASADLEIRVVGTYGQDTGYIIGDAANAETVRFTLNKERAKWLVSSTEGMQRLMK